MRRLLTLSSLLSLSLLSATQADTSAEKPSFDTCRAVAAAKFEQWQQSRILIDMTKTFSDGSTKKEVIVVTENTAYGLRRGVWNSANATKRGRLTPSVSQILLNMQLAECASGGPAQESGLAATLYNFTYLPDDDGYVAHGTIWIADDSGLPLREEMRESAPPANQLVATDISATYKYNSDFVIPPGAENAESTRLFDTASMIRHMRSSPGRATSSR
jgi:hypothetical protein